MVAPRCCLDFNRRRRDAPVGLVFLRQTRDLLFPRLVSGEVEVLTTEALRGAEATDSVLSEPAGQCVQWFGNPVW